LLNNISEKLRGAKINNEKKLYAKPHLTMHGDVDTLTQNRGRGHRVTGNGGYKGNGYGHCINAGNPGHPICDQDCWQVVS
jgi:hypothetical protein